MYVEEARTRTGNGIPDVFLNSEKGRLTKTLLSIFLTGTSRHVSKNLECFAVNSVAASGTTIRGSKSGLAAPDREVPL